MRRSNLVSPATAAALAAVLGLAGCSGGGDDGGASDPGFTLSRSSVSFSASDDGPLPGPQTVAVNITARDAAFIVAGFPPETTPPSWLDLSLYGSASSWTLELAIRSTDLALGTYTATVRVLTARADESVIGTRDIAVSYTVAPVLGVGPSALAFAHVVGGPVETKQLYVGGSAGVAFTASASQPWVTIDPASGTAPANLTVGFDPSGLGTGTHQATVTIATAELSLTIPVTLVVSAPALVTSAPALAFSGVNGAVIATQEVQVSMNNGTAVAFTATPSAGWLVLGASGGTTPATITVGLDPSVGPLASGAHEGVVTFSTGGATPLTATVDVDATLTPATLILPPELLLGGVDGRDFGSQPLEVSLDTGANAHAWSAVPSAAWMSLSAASGDASSAPATIDVSPVAAGLTGGTRTGSIDFTATVNGDTVTGSVPVTFHLEAHKLLASTTGVAFTSTPGPKLLTRTLRVDDTLGLATPWTATSDQAWLSVTPSGTAPGDLVLTADPAGLATDALYLATVTLSSSDTTVENAETIRVGLWVGSTAPASETVAGSWAPPVTDPIRPYAYVHSGGSDVTVFHVYTGAEVGTIPSVAGSLAGMAVSGDGSTLHAVDKATWKLVAVDLDTWEIGAPVSLANTETPYPRLAWTRANGQPVLLVTDGTARDPADGAVLWSAGHGSSYSPRVAASLDGTVFCWAGVQCRSLSWTSLGGGTLTVGTRAGFMGERDGALSPDGSILYVPVISGYGGVPSYSWVGYSTTTGQLAIQLLSLKAYPNNAEVGWDGRIFAGRDSPISTEPDAWIFSPAGAQLGSLRVAAGYNHSLADAALALSGDLLRIAATTSDYFSEELRFVSPP